MAKTPVSTRPCQARSGTPSGALCLSDDGGLARVNTPEHRLKTRLVEISQPEIRIRDQAVVDALIRRGQWTAIDITARHAHALEIRMPPDFGQRAVDRDPVDFRAGPIRFAIVHDDLDVPRQVGAKNRVAPAVVAAVDR